MHIHVRVHILHISTHPHRCDLELTCVYLCFRTWISRPGSRDLDLETWISRPGSRDLDLGTWISHLHACASVFRPTHSVRPMNLYIYACSVHLHMHTLSRTDMHVPLFQIMRTDKSGRPKNLANTWLKGGFGATRNGCTLVDESNAWVCVDTKVSYR